MSRPMSSGSGGFRLTDHFGTGTKIGASGISSLAAPVDSGSFGPYAGYSLSIPFSGLPTVEYVLTDKLAFAAAGEGVLASLVGNGGTSPGPLAALAIAPPRLDPEAWRTLLELIDAPHERWLVEHLMRWRDGQIAVTLDGGSLVVSATGTRK